MTDLFFATYDELVLLTKAWKMHGSLSYVVGNILIELASNSTRYTGGKLAIGCHPNTCTANSQGGFGCTNCKIDRVDQNRLESRSMEISPWGLVVFSCLDCDVREVS